jgi:hypothetical protein
MLELLIRVKSVALSKRIGRRCDMSRGATSGLMHRSKAGAELFGSLQINDQLKLDRGLDGKLARLFTLEDAIGIVRRAITAAPA